MALMYTLKAVSLRLRRQSAGWEGEPSTTSASMQQRRVLPNDTNTVVDTGVPWDSICVEAI